MGDNMWEKENEQEKTEIEEGQGRSSEITTPWEPAFLPEEKVDGRTFRKEKEAARKPPQKGSGLLSTQLLLCTLLLGGTILLCRFGYQQQLASAYEKYFDTGVQLPPGKEIIRFANAKVEWVQQNVGSLIGLLEGDVDAKSEQTSLEGKGQEEEPDEQKGETAQSSSQGSLQSNSSADNASEPAEQGQSADQALLNGKGSGEGVWYNADGKVQMPANATLSPYMLTEAPLLPVSGKLTSPYGFRENPVGEGEDFHTGIDIAAAENTPIKAAFAGTVEKVGTSAISGNYVTLRHGNNVRTTYCHMKKPYVFEGQKVKRGQSIGCVGLTGQTTGYHLHFEISINGQRVDPLASFKGVL